MNGFNKYRKHFAIFTAVFILVICSITTWAYWANNKADSTVVKKSESTADSSSKGEQTSNKPHDSYQEGTSVSNSKAAVSGKEIKKPTGNFVSNHRPSITNPQNSAISSSCETTPEAICTISFTKNDKTITLDPKKVDAEGNAYWHWNLKDYDFSAGAWKITAKATLNSKSLTSDDALEFNVTP